MNELRCKVLDHRRRPRRLCRGDPRRRTRPRHGARRGRPVRRRLPACRLHPVEGDHPRRRRSACARRAAGAERHRPLAWRRPTLDYAKTIAWKDAIVSRLASGVGALLKKAEVRTLRGRATHRRRQERDRPRRHRRPAHRCEHLVIATGSEPVELPALPFGGDVLSSTEALALTEVPRALAVVGAGYIGMELGMAFAKLGAKVTIVEALPKILPLYDEELTQPVARRARRSRHRDAARRAGAAVSPRARSRSPSADGDETIDRGRQGPGRGRPARRARTASASNASTSTMAGRSSASTTAARPRCATSGRSAT